MRAAPRSFAALAVIGAFAAGSDARADPKKECAAAYDLTQTLREQGKLIEARKQAVACSASTCSVHAITDCARWLAEIDASMPTVVLAAEDAAGADTPAVRVLADGRVLAERLDGRAVAMDPGEHVLRFELGGAEAIEHKVVIRQGEKNRRLTVSFKNAPARVAASAAPPRPPAPPKAAPPAARPQGAAPHVEPSRRRVPVWAWISGGAGLVALGVGAGFGVASLQAHSTLVDKCGGDPSVCPSRLDAETKPLASGRDRDRRVFIGLAAVGVAGIGAAVVGIVTARPKAARAETSFVVAPFGSAEGGGVVARGRF